MPGMMPTSFVEAVAPPTGKFIKNGLSLFERAEHLLQNGILHFVFSFCQLSKIALESPFTIFLFYTKGGLSYFVHTQKKTEKKRKNGTL